MTHIINGVETFAEVVIDPATGRVQSVDIAIHVPSYEALIAVALAKNLMVRRQEIRKDILTPAQFDPATFEQTAPAEVELVVLREWVEELRDANFLHVPIVLEPAECDADRNITKPAVMDPLLNYNVRFVGDLANKKEANGWFAWEMLLLEWMGAGTEETVNGKVPGMSISGVGLVDLSAVETPQGGIA